MSVMNKMLPSNPTKSVHVLVSTFFELGPRWRGQNQKSSDENVQIFTAKILPKGKAYTLNHFHKFEYLRTVIHHVMKLVHAGETVELWKGQGERENILELIKANITILC